MTKNKVIGKMGEEEVCKLVPCPNCQSKLILFPENYRLYDVRCSQCQFMAQVKTVSKPPRKSILGAGLDVYERNEQEGNLPPHLIVNFRWNDKEGLHRIIRFYPFISKENILKRQLSPTARRANYRMFNYINLDTAPFKILYDKVEADDGQGVEIL